jgi:hypothetical protein
MVAVLAHQQEHTADAQPVNQEVLHAAEPYQLRVRHIANRLSAKIHLQKYELIPKPPTFPQKNCHRSAFLPLSKKELSQTAIKLCTIQNYCLTLRP